MGLIIGMDPHKRSPTVELVHDGEVVVDVPPKLSAQVRVFATGNGRKTDPVDARSVALAALYAPADRGPRPVTVDDELVVMGLLVDRRDELGRARTQTVNRLHRLLLELFPGGAKQFPSADALHGTLRDLCLWHEPHAGVLPEDVAPGGPRRGWRSDAWRPSAQPRASTRGPFWGCGADQVAWHSQCSGCHWSCTAMGGGRCSAERSCCWSTPDARPDNRIR